MTLLGLSVGVAARLALPLALDVALADFFLPDRVPAAGLGSVTVCELLVSPDLPGAGCDLTFDLESDEPVVAPGNEGAAGCFV